MIFELELELIHKQLASTLSDGQKRKTLTGIALIFDRKVIMLDEPTFGIDTTTLCKFWQMLKNTSKADDKTEEDISEYHDFSFRCDIGPVKLLTEK